ncbi:MAG: FAD-binding protein [Candidatus Heimdallarchaeota archaeon]|nr:FAD-binding protein [Candidatus Heimdallarchaeota archaeon]
MEKLRRIIIGSNASIFQKIDPQTNIEAFLPTNEQEIKEAITFARENNLIIVSKGAGSGLSGACTGGAREKVVISSMRLKRVHELNFEEGYALVDPGVTPDELNEFISQKKEGWKFFVTPSSRDIATLGGILSTDGGGNDAWLAGTMVDNVLAVELLDYHNNKIIIERLEEESTRAKISCENKELEKKLQTMKLSLMDISGSHGTLGYISRLKVRIKPIDKTRNSDYALVHAKTFNAFGKVIYHLIEQNIPLKYGEVIVEARHPEIAEKTRPPMFIFEFPSDLKTKIKSICETIVGVTFQSVSQEKFELMQDIRIKMAKRNPPEGVQVALFEGYGVYGENLLHFEEMIDAINNTLRDQGFEPFMKYGHAPSKWHIGNKKREGIIMHSREIRPDNLTSEMVFNAIIALVETCKKLGITPKPEHKWPYLKTSEKHQRLIKLRKILGEKFNPFILDCTLDELKELVL